MKRQKDVLLARRDIGELLPLAGVCVATIPYVGLGAIADSWRAPIDGSVAENPLFLLPLAFAALVARYVRRVPIFTEEVAIPRRVPNGRAENGQSLVEFALLFPLLLIFIGAIFVFGMALHTRSNLQQAMREGARQAAVGKSLAEVQDLAAGNANSTLDPSDVLWCHPVSSNGTQGKVGDPVRVYVEVGGAAGYPYELIPTGGIFNTVFGVSALTVRMKPVATARLEKSVASPVNCP